ncbi:Ig-like domain repeat protein [Nocardioides ultimimeridianus]
MKVTTFAKLGVGVTVAATMSLGTITAANAAGVTANQEDPTANGYLVGVGSDTIQDVLYGISQDLGTTPDGSMPEMSSWTATGTGTLTYRSGLVASPRPNGSGAGFKALEDSIGVTAAGLAKPGDVDFARASGTQATAGVTQPTIVSGYTTAAQAGVVTEIPFAIDSISFAVPAGSPFLLSNGGKGLTEANLASIYDGTNKYVSTVDGSLSTTSGANLIPINAFVPKPGSGSRQFFLKGLNAVDSSGIPLGSNKGDSLFASAGTPSATPTPYVGATDYSGAPVQEHDATAITTGVPAGVAVIAPFSGAKFLGYHNGVIADPSGKVAGTDYVLVPFDSSIGGTAHAVLPYVDHSGTYVPNPAYITDGIESSAKLTREVYNIIATDVVANPGASIKNRAMYDTFVGKGSKICLDTATIAAYGFMKDANCGTTGFSADLPSVSTLTVTPPATTPVAGGSAMFTVAAQSTGNLGGTATVTINGTAYHVTLPPAVAPATQSVATVKVPTPAAGTFTIGADTDGFTPTLQGVAPSQEATGTYVVAKATPVVKAVAPKVSHTVAGKVTVTVTATGLAPTGTVTIVVKKGTTTKATLSSKALVGGKYVGTLPKLPAGTYYVYVSYSGNANISAKASTKLATLTVS